MERRAAFVLLGMLYLAVGTLVTVQAGESLSLFSMGTPVASRVRPSGVRARERLPFDSWCIVPDEAPRSSRHLLRSEETARRFLLSARIPARSITHGSRDTVIRVQLMLIDVHDDRRNVTPTEGAVTIAKTCRRVAVKTPRLVFLQVFLDASSVTHNSFPIIAGV